MEQKKRIEVAVGVIVRDQSIFLTKRADDQHQGGRWEFPGGKKEAGESMLQALERELFEEVGIKVGETEPLLDIQHSYPEKDVYLDVYLVVGFTGEPSPQEGQVGAWFNKDRLNDLTFPDANGPILSALMSAI